jgi:triosephosphate isomerase
MNLTVARAMAYLDGLLPLLPKLDDREVAVAVPFTALSAVGERLRDHSILLTAQDLFWEDEGPYTGEISPPMLQESGVEMVIIGHSERRLHLGEDDRMVNRKVQAAVRTNLRPVICVGESESTRNAGRAGAFVRAQVMRALEDVPPGAAMRLAVAYEPVWAIGTGQAASPADASEMHEVIRNELANHFGEASRSVPVLYGGSVTDKNVDAFMSKRGIDGLLVGGASLKPKEFARIVQFLPEIS